MRCACVRALRSCIESGNWRHRRRSEVALPAASEDDSRRFSHASPGPPCHPAPLTSPSALSASMPPFLSASAQVSSTSLPSARDSPAPNAAPNRVDAALPAVFLPCQVPLDSPVPNAASNRALAAERCGRGLPVKALLPVSPDWRKAARSAG